MWNINTTRCFALNSVKALQITKMNRFIVLLVFLISIKSSYQHDEIEDEAEDLVC
jgi:hypothetical protein